MRYFAMTDDEQIVPLGDHEHITEAFDNEPENTQWVFSEKSLNALIGRATAALLKEI